MPPEKVLDDHSYYPTFYPSDPSADGACPLGMAPILHFHSFTYYWKLFIVSLCFLYCLTTHFPFPYSLTYLSFTDYHLLPLHLYMHPLFIDCMCLDFHSSPLTSHTSHSLISHGGGRSKDLALVAPPTLLLLLYISYVIK